MPAGAIASAALAAVARHQNLPLWLATLAALCFIVMLIVSSIWTFPANQATDNWMTLPKRWEALRRRWKYSHAANAALALLAFLSGDNVRAFVAIGVAGAGEVCLFPDNSDIAMSKL
ncbi:MAG: hypothetical protein ACTHNH_01810 [Mesorhizobium sp.]